MSTGKPRWIFVKYAAKTIKPSYPDKNWSFAEFNLLFINIHVNIQDMTACLFEKVNIIQKFSRGLFIMGTPCMCYSETKTVSYGNIIFYYQH